MTWDTVTWKVLNEDESELLGGFCQAGCHDNTIFSFNKVGIAGVYRYSVEMKNGEETIMCTKRFAVFGTFLKFFHHNLMIFNSYKLINVFNSTTTDIRQASILIPKTRHFGDILYIHFSKHDKLIPPST